MSVCWKPEWCECPQCGPLVRVDPTYVVHGLRPMTTKELGALECGHCHHQLTIHVTDDKGNTQCGICHCFRRANEDILKPHNFGGAS